MSDCLWGLLDGMNDAGLAVSLAFGGRRVTGEGFSVPLVLRYLLEVCETTEQAVRTLERIPVQASYNLTILDQGGAALTAAIAPDRPPVLGCEPVATNHPRVVEWAEHARATRSVERRRRLLELVADPAAAEADVLDAFLELPLHSRADESGVGTLYTAIHRPADGVVEYRWPGLRWRQSFDAFEEGTRMVRRYAAADPTANVAV
jgi:predicted choloylglycine hydrolase